MIIDIILLKYPGIQNVTYWHTQKDGTPWENPYEGLVWENTSIPKPTKEELDQWGLDFAQAYMFEQNKKTNQPIYDQLKEIDFKSIRALRTNDIQRLSMLEQQAVNLRQQLLPTE